MFLQIIIQGSGVQGSDLAASTRCSARSATINHKKFRKVSLDFENALVAREKLTEQLRAQERLVKASKEYVRLAQLQYQGGYATYLTVLSAQQQLFPAELNHAQYLASACNAYVNIYKAMGGGWVTASEKMTTAAGSYDF